MLLFSLAVIVHLCLVSAQDRSSSTGPFNPSNGQPAVISKITGCTNQQNGTTIDCARSSELTIYGSGFMTGLEYEPYPTVRISFTLGPESQLVYCQPLFQSSFNDTYMRCAVINAGFRQFPENQVVPITYHNQLTNYHSPQFYGVSFKYEQLPVIDRVTGCASTSPDGKSVYNCHVETDLVTLVGSGFLSAESDWMKVTLNDEVTYISPDIKSDLLVSFSDTMIVLSFADSYQLLSEIDAADEKPIPFSITSLQVQPGSTSPVWSMGPVFLQFAEFPPPSITNLTVETVGNTDCVIDMSTGSVRFLKCVPGSSQIRIIGRYLFKGAVITVGGQTVRLSTWSTSYSGLVIVMPILDVIEGRFYDITVTTLAGSITWPGVIQFVSTPVVTGIGACIDGGYDYSSYNIFFGQCLAGEKLTVSVLNVKNTLNPRVLIYPYNNKNLTAECHSAVVVDQRTVQCTMSPPAGNSYPDWSVSYLSVQFGNGETTDPVYLQTPFATPNSPRLTAITGCYSSSNDPLRLNQCLATPTKDTILTLHGVRLRNTFGSNWSVAINWFVTCAEPIVLDDQTLTCLVPDLEGTSLTLDTPYPVILSDWTHQLNSNAGYITFVMSEKHESSKSSSSSNTTTIVLATIFSIVGAVLILAASLILYRRMCKDHKRGVADPSEGFSSRNRHVELSEVSEN